MPYSFLEKRKNIKQVSEQCDGIAQPLYGIDFCHGCVGTVQKKQEQSAVLWTLDCTHCHVGASHQHRGENERCNKTSSKRLIVNWAAGSMEELLRNVCCNFNIPSLIRFESVSFMAQLMLRGKVVSVIMCFVPLTSFFVECLVSDLLLL